MSRKATLLLVIAAASAANGEPQNVTAISDGWRFNKADTNGAEAAGFDDSSWTVVSLPHTWNDKDTLSGGDYYRGPGWYRLKLAIPESDFVLINDIGTVPDRSAKGKRVFVHFEAASLVADVYFNGVHLGQHRGGFTAFCYELTPYMRWDGDNVLAVRVDNSSFKDVAPLSGDFNLFGGIYRPVWLVIKNPVCITPLDYASPGIYFKQTEVSKEEAIVDVLAKVSNGLDERATVQSRPMVDLITQSQGQLFSPLQME